MNNLVDLQDPLNPQVLILCEAAHGNIMAESKCIRFLGIWWKHKTIAKRGIFPISPSPPALWIPPKSMKEKQATD